MPNPERQGNENERETLVRDAMNYYLDITSIAETHLTEDILETITTTTSKDGKERKSIYYLPQKRPDY